MSDLDAARPQHLAVNVVERFDAAGKPFIHVDVNGTSRPTPADDGTPPLRARVLRWCARLLYPYLIELTADDLARRTSPLAPALRDVVQQELSSAGVGRGSLNL